LRLSGATAQDIGGPTPHGWHYESWVAFAIAVTSVLTAWLMNYSVPKVRVIGTLLAAMGCLTVAG